METIASGYSTISNILYSELSYTQEWMNFHVSEHVNYHYRQYLIKLVKRHKKIVTVFDSYYNFVVKSLLNLVNDGEHSNLLVYLLGRPNKARLVEENCSYINFICIMLYDLFILIDRVNQLFPEHESLYYHRRFLIYNLVKIPYDYHGLPFEKPKIHESNIDLCENITNCDTIVNIQCGAASSNWPKLSKLSNHPKCNLYEIISNCEKKFISQNTNLYASKYRKWLTHVIGFE